MRTAMLQTACAAPCFLLCGSSRGRSLQPSLPSHILYRHARTHAREIRFDRAMEALYLEGTALNLVESEGVVHKRCTHRPTTRQSCPACITASLSSSTRPRPKPCQQQGLSVCLFMVSWQVGPCSDAYLGAPGARPPSPGPHRQAPGPREA